MKLIFNGTCGGMTTYERPEGGSTVKYTYDFFLKKETLNEISVTYIS